MFSFIILYSEAIQIISITLFLTLVLIGTDDEINNEQYKKTSAAFSFSHVEDFLTLKLTLFYNLRPWCQHI